MVKNNNVIAEVQVIKIAKQILNAFKLLVEENIIHKDIKPENILL